MSWRIRTQFFRGVGHSLWVRETENPEDSDYIAYVRKLPPLTGLQIDQLSDTSVSLSWTFYEEEGVEFEFRVNGQFSTSVTVLTDSSVRISGLEPTTQYLIEILIHDAQGKTTEFQSRFVSVFTLPAEASMDYSQALANFQLEWVALPRKYEIVIVADGLGLPLLQYAQAQNPQIVYPEDPRFHSLSVFTEGADEGPVDSGASATAMSTGTRTFNSYIGMSTTGYPLVHLMEIFSHLEKRTGLVTNTPVHHATPAGFGAHVLSRYDYQGVIDSYLRVTRPSLVLGGGSPYLSPRDAEAMGVRLVSSIPELEAFQSHPSFPAIGAFGDRELPYEADRQASETGEYDGIPRLPALVRTALRALDWGPGFFLMIESGLIDWACHANDLPRALPEVALMQEIMDEIDAWMQEFSIPASDVSLRIISDHETGGFSAETGFSQTGHTMDPVLFLSNQSIGEPHNDTRIVFDTLSPGALSSFQVGVDAMRSLLLSSVW